jgi:hypothetical protein
VFKYANGGSTPAPTQITLTANLQNVTMGKWQYKNGFRRLGGLSDYGGQREHHRHDAYRPSPRTNIWVKRLRGTEDHDIGREHRR